MEDLLLQLFDKQKNITKVLESIIIENDELINNLNKRTKLQSYVPKKLKEMDVENSTVSKLEL